MKERIKDLLKVDGIYLLFGIIILITTLLIATTTFSKGDYSLQLPTTTLFGQISYIAILVLGLAGIFAFRNIDKKQLSIEKLYLMLVIPLGLLYCIANPLGKVPDEDHHARKAMAISQGNFFSVADENGDAYEYLNSKLNEAVTRSVTTYEDSFSRITCPETTDTVKLWYTTMALYAPICHAPQAFAMFLTRLFGAGVTVQCFSARLFNFAFAVFLIYKAIKLIPFKKYLVLFIALLPVTLNEMASMSSNALTISISLFYISYILFLKYDESKNKITKKDIVILTISSITVALCKIVYLPLCLLLFVIPKEKFNSLKQKNLIIIAIFAFSVILNLAWLIYCTRFLVEFNPGVNGKEQLLYILTHPFSYLLIVFRTMNIYNQTFIVSLCGEGLGSYNAQASVLFIYPCILLLSLLCFSTDSNDKKEIDWKTRTIFFITFLAIIALIYTSIYIQWNSVKKPFIEGIQARYFLPIILLTPIFFNNKTLIINRKISYRYLALFLLFFNLNALSCIMFTYINGTVIDWYVK